MVSHRFFVGAAGGCCVGEPVQGCGGDDSEKQRKETSRLSRASFQILQKKYARTEWAKKTPHHF